MVSMQPGTTCLWVFSLCAGPGLYSMWGELSAQRMAVLAAADSYAAPNGSASHLVVVSFINKCRKRSCLIFDPRARVRHIWRTLRPPIHALRRDMTRRAGERPSTRRGWSWLYQELGDFRRPTEYNREAVDIGRRAKNANVEVSSPINLSLDELNLGDPRRALALMEETRTVGLQRSSPTPLLRVLDLRPTASSSARRANQRAWSPSESCRPWAEPWSSAAGRWQEALKKSAQVVSSAAADTLKKGAEARGLSPEAVVEKVTGPQLGEHIAIVGDHVMGGKHESDNVVEK
jgi:hypothetical protein